MQGATLRLLKLQHVATLTGAENFRDSHAQIPRNESGATSATLQSPVALFLTHSPIQRGFQFL